MAELKTKVRRASVSAFLAKIPEAGRRKDAQAVARMMQRACGARPRLWGPNIVGFGTRLLKYSSGRELEWPLVAFSPRKPALVLYLGRPDGKSAALLKRLGPHKLGGGCLYLRSLEGVSLPVLDKLVRATVAKARGQA
jgi:hypothetical protein